MNVPLLCIGLLGLLVVGLGFLISLRRGSSEVLIGTPDEPSHPLHKLVRAHGNATEYCAMLAVLIYVLGARDPGAITLAIMVGAVAARYLHAAGMLLSPTLAQVQPLRLLGALGTYVFGGILVAQTLWLAFF